MAMKTFTIWDVNSWDDQLVWDHASSSLATQIKENHVKVFRKAYIKRRQLSDGLFESEWVEVTKDVKRWGSVNSNIDFQRHGKLSFSGSKILMQNIEGRYNPNDNVDSLWFGFADQQRSLFKIEAGFYFQWKGSDDVWRTEIFPEDPTVFVGILSGNMNVSGRNEVTLNIKPLTQVFRDFPGNLITGLGSSITASKFIEILRDQTDGSSNFIFRPFFGDTTTNWEITATSSVYVNLTSGAAPDLHQLDTWQVIEKLGQAENFIPYITPQGKFRWVSKNVASTTAFEFYGIGIVPNFEFGHTIKEVFSYGKKLTNFYSRVAIKYEKADTNTSFTLDSLPFAINGTNTAWNLGHRTFSLENFWLDTATANSLSTAVFNEVSSLDEEIHFSTSFIPQLNLLDRVELNYDATDFASGSSFFDINEWDSELIWDVSRGDALILTQEPFKVLSININLDNFETKFVCRQIN